MAPGARFVRHCEPMRHASSARTARTARTVLATLASLVAVGFALRARAAAPPYAKHVCPNGLEVIVVERHATPLMTVEIAVHNGAMAEPPDYNGLSHLYEHMFFKGNKVLPDQLAYTARLRDLGMLWNGTTDDDRVNYFFTTTSDHFADAMAFMRDSVTSPLFDKGELDRERVVVTGEMDRDEAEPRPPPLARGRGEGVLERYPSWQNALGDQEDRPRDDAGQDADDPASLLRPEQLPLDRDRRREGGRRLQAGRRALRRLGQGPRPVRQVPAREEPADPTLRGRRAGATGPDVRRARRVARSFVGRTDRFVLVRGRPGHYAPLRSGVEVPEGARRFGGVCGGGASAGERSATTARSTSGSRRRSRKRRRLREGGVRRAAEV